MISHILINVVISNALAMYLYVYNMYIRTHLCHVFAKFYYLAGFIIYFKYLRRLRVDFLSRIMALYKCFSYYGSGKCGDAAACRGSVQ